MIWISKQPLAYAGNTISVTFSCGIKEVDEKDKSVSQLLGMVDEAMYAAKNAGRNRAIVILSQKSGKGDIVEGLYCGADDYVTKPFSMAELEARIMRVLKCFDFVKAKNKPLHA
ncbi:hypothetical protein JCM15765_13890 [Paradesulfitobacterium aromaticivorans]